MKTKRIKSGKYEITVGKFVFELIKADTTWVLWNKVGTEVMRDSTKTGIMNALGSYDGYGIESLSTQEWASY